MGSSPDNDGTVQHCQMGRVRQARQTRCNGSEPVVEPPQALEPARIWRIWAGQQCTSFHRWWAVTPKPESVAGGEATRKACGVLVARLQGHSRAPILPTELLVNVGTVPGSPCRRPSQGWWRAGPPSADGCGAGRRVRSSPRPGKPATWRRDPARCADRGTGMSGGRR